MGSVIVMPTPTSEPLMAAMVGLEQAWIARVTRPPLFGCVIMGGTNRGRSRGREMGIERG